ncbi:hypothetical protein V6N13_083709 [Hibiscus sabdariffa]
MWMGATSSDWVGGGGDCGVSGVEPNGESGVLSLLTGTSAGVVAGLVVVWLETGTTGGDAAGDCRGSTGVTGAKGPASSVVAAVVWIGLDGGVGIATLRGVASATSIFCICSSAKGRDKAGKVQDAFVICAGCCQLFGQNFSNIDAIACHYGVNEEQPHSIYSLVVGGGHDVPFHKRIPQLCFGLKAEAADRMGVSARCVPGGAFFTKKVLDLLKIFFFEATEQSVEARVIVWQAQNGVDGGCVGWHSPATNRCIIFASRVAGVEL